MSIDSKVKINDARIKLDGDFFWLGFEDLKFAEATGTLRYAGPTFHASSDVVLFPGLTGEANLNAGDAWVNGEMVATVEVPSEIPLIGGLTLSKVEMAINSDPKPSIRGTVSVFGIGKVTVKVNSSGDLVFPDRVVSQPDGSGRNDPANNKPALAGDSPDASANFLVFENYSRSRSQLLSQGQAGVESLSSISISSPNPTFIRLFYAADGGAPEFNVTAPDGTLYTPDSVETDPNVAADVGFLRNDTARDAAFFFAAPQPGIYEVEVLSPETLGEYGIEVLTRNLSPDFEFVDVASDGVNLGLEWMAFDPEEDAQITFYLDTNREGLNGLPLAGPFSEDSPEQTTVIDLAEKPLTPGTYWLYAQIDDGLNAPVSVYSTEPLFLANPLAPPSVRDINVTTVGTTAFVEWAAVQDPAIMAYEVKWTTNIEDIIFEGSQSVQPELQQAVIGGLELNTVYKFTVVATKLVESTLVSRRQSLLRLRTEAIAAGPERTGEPATQTSKLSNFLQKQEAESGTNWASFQSNTQVSLAEAVEESSNVESLAVEFDIVETTAEPGGNNIPEFLSLPPKSVLATDSYRYDVELRDRDGDGLSLRLVTGPADMVLAGRSLVWEPSGRQGVFEVSLEASDGIATTSQTWNLSSGALRPDTLQIVSPPPLEVAPGSLFRYTVAVTEGCDAPVVFSLLTAPQSMTIDPDSGVVTWLTPDGEDNLFVVLAEQLCNGRTLSASHQFFLDLEGPEDDVGTFIPFPPTCDAGPTAALTVLANDPIEGVSTLRVDLTGTAPWSLVWSDGLLQTDLASSPVYREVPSDQADSYTLVAFSDANCLGDLDAMPIFESEVENIPLLDRWARLMMMLLIAIMGLAYLRNRQRGYVTLSDLL